MVKDDTAKKNIIENFVQKKKLIWKSQRKQNYRPKKFPKIIDIDSVDEDTTSCDCKTVGFCYAKWTVVKERGSERNVLVGTFSRDKLDIFINVVTVKLMFTVKF